MKPDSASDQCERVFQHFVKLRAWHIFVWSLKNCYTSQHADLREVISSWWSVFVARAGLHIHFIRITYTNDSSEEATRIVKGSFRVRLSNKVPLTHNILSHCRARMQHSTEWSASNISILFDQIKHRCRGAARAHIRPNVASCDRVSECECVCVCECVQMRSAKV